MPCLIVTSTLGRLARENEQTQHPVSLQPPLTHVLANRAESGLPTVGVQWASMVTLRKAVSGLWVEAPWPVVLSIVPHLVSPALKTDMDSKPELTPMPSALLTFLKITLAMWARGHTPNPVQRPANVLSSCRVTHHPKVWKSSSRMRGSSQRGQASMCPRSLV